MSRFNSPDPNVENTPEAMRLAWEQADAAIAEQIEAENEAARDD